MILKRKKETRLEHLKAFWTIGKLMQQSKKHGRPRACPWFPAGERQEGKKARLRLEENCEPVADHVAPALTPAERKHGLPRDMNHLDCTLNKDIEGGVIG